MPPSRSTEWRWKTKGQPRLTTSGRKRGRPLGHVSGNMNAKTLWRAAMLIEEAIRLPGAVDHLLVLREERERARWPEVQRIFDTIAAWSYPANLIAVATWKGFHIGSRKRKGGGEIWSKQVMIQKLKRAGLSAGDAVEYAEAYYRGDEETQLWIDELMMGLETNMNPKDKRQCSVSKIFRHVSDRMASHWRYDRRFEYCVSELHGIVWRARQNQALKPLTPANLAEIDEKKMLKRHGINPKR